MPGFTGIELAGYLKEAAADIQTVFVTGYNNYAQQAFDVEAVAIFSSPSRPSVVQAVIDKVGKTASHKAENEVVFRTFGRFDIFVRGELLIFKSQKAKELVACVWTTEAAWSPWRRPSTSCGRTGSLTKRPKALPQGGHDRHPHL